MLLTARIDLANVPPLYECLAEFTGTDKGILILILALLLGICSAITGYQTGKHAGEKGPDTSDDGNSRSGE
jgi:hypothetical protein